jgi:hypothetical protein
MAHHFDAFADDIIAPIADSDPDALLDTKQVARLLRVSVEWLEIGRCRVKGREKGYGPPFIRINKRMVRYRVGDLIKWLRSRKPQNPQNP